MIATALISAAVTIVTLLVGTIGAKAVKAATASKLHAEGHAATTTAEAGAEKSAVDGYDLLTGRLEAQVSRFEKRLAEVEKERDGYRDRLEHAEDELADCRRKLERVTRLLERHNITEDTA